MTASVAASAANVISFGPLAGGRDAVLAHLGVAEDVLHDHDRVVDDEADGERQAEQGEGVEREAAEVDDRDRAEERHRDREEHVHRARERAEEEPAHERGEDDARGTSSRPISLTDSVDELRRVEDDVELHPGREGLLQLRDAPRVTGGDRDRVRAALLEDAHRLHGHAVRARDRVMSSKPSSTSATSWRRIGSLFTLLDDDVRSVSRSGASPRTRTSSSRPAVCRARRPARYVLLL